MKSIPRHQCMLYEGPPSRHLPMLATLTRDKLNQNFRCLYLNTPPMVAGIRSYLAAAGIDVEKAMGDGRLLLSAAQDHLVEGLFDLDLMLHTLERTLQIALEDGYAGLWAVGDMTWEMGPAKDFSKLLDYEWRLEKFFHEHPQLGGICQYHAETLPPTVLREGLLSHPALFVNATLSRINPHYLRPELCTPAALQNPDLDAALSQALL